MNQVYFDTYKMTGKCETETIDGQSIDIFTEPVEQDFMLRAINDGNRQLILRAKDGDITTDGISINENTGGSDDWTIGNATSKSLSVTFLNEPKESESGIYDGELLSRVTFDRLAAYYGYKASSSTWSSPGTGRTSYWVAPDTNAVFYGTANGAYMNGTKIAVTNAKSIVGFFLVCRGEPNSDTRNYPIIFGTDTLFLWDTSQQVYVAVDYEDYYDTEDYIFMLAKLTDNGYSGCVDGNVMKTWRVETQESVTVYTEESWQYVPVGVFDFSNVSIYGTVYTAEVYDLMSLMEVDATEWLATNWGRMTQTADGIATAIAAYFNSLYPDLANYVTISSSAVNLGVQLLRNPFTEKRYTFREVLGLIAESIGCNVRISPTRVITFYTYGTTPAQAYYDVNGTLTLQDIVVTPHSIVNGSRDKGRYAVPQVDKLVYLATNGGVYTNGTGNNTYTMTGNPIVENGAQAASVFARNLYALLHAVPSYYASKLTVAHANPCIEAGDLITIRNREDNTTYNILLTDISSHWAGLNVADYSADGKQERTALDSTEIYADNGETTASLEEKLTGVIPDASTSTPLMDGTAAVGTSDAFARGDHRHPTDTSRVPTSRKVNGKALTEDITLAASDVGALPNTTTVPTAYTSNPAMDGTASPGSGTAYSRGDHVHPSDTSRVAKTGGTMTGQLKTSFRESVAMGSYGAAATTIPNLVAELRFSSGCAGSVNISTAYTWNDVTVSTGWYNFMYMPHRSGGVNGAASGDNCNYGTVLLAGMTIDDVMYRIRINGGTLAEIRRICDSSTTGARVNGNKTLSLASGTSLTEIATFTLSPGTWHVSAALVFASNSTGRRQANVSSSSGGAAVIAALACNTNATSGTQTLMNFGYDIVVSANTTYYLNAYQNSGSTLSTTGYYSAVRII